ncbi:MAG: hypothetical protein H0Z34_12355 [Brevibacillus sp.]|nr:hypothetical protein [Brevibacillus sp.]
MKRVITIFIVLLLLGMSLSACTQTEPDPARPAPGEQPASEEGGVLLIQPFNLFEGEGTRFKPFFDWAGAVKLKYSGTKQEIHVAWELWENGVRQQTLSSSGTIMDQKDDGTTAYEGELILSIDRYEHDGMPQYLTKAAFVDESGHSLIENSTAGREAFQAQATIELHEPLKITEGQRAIVWGVQATDENVIRSHGTVEETVKQAKWALVAVVSLGD